MLRSCVVFLDGAADGKVARTFSSR